MPAVSPPKVIKDPRISLNKLGEYLKASAVRRRAIIKDQKKPPGAGVVTWYLPVNAALADYFEHKDKFALESAIKLLKADKSGTDWQVMNRNLSAEALGKLGDMLDEFDFTGVAVEPFPTTWPTSMHFAGVKVSVRPDFLVRRKSDDVVVGAIKLSHNKEHALEKAECEHVATVIWRFLQTLEDTEPEPKWCLAVATPTKRVVSAPKSHKAREADVIAACEEIAAVWGKS